MARLSTSTSRTATLGIAAAAMLAATSLARPTRASEPGKGAVSKIDGLPAQCLKAGNELAQLKCGTAYYRQRRLDAEARSADAKGRGAAAEKHTATNKQGSEAALATKGCYDTLLDEVSAAKKIAPLTPEQKAAFKTRAAGCENS